jgi:hypothetical protein
MTSRRYARWGGILGALVLPILLLAAELHRVGDPVALVGLLAWSGALSSIWPLGGGMLALGTYRSRVIRWEWTHDVDRSAGEAFLAGLTLGGVTAVGFLVYLPLLGEIWLSFGTSLSTTALAWGAIAAMIVVTALRYRRESPLYLWSERIESGESVPREELERWFRAIAALMRPDGAVGHLGGIGAFTVGLHEHLDAERILRAASEAGIAGAAAVHGRALDFLAARARSDGGFPAYPGGEGRLELTARAARALGDRLTAEQREAHRAFARRCAKGDAFGRSPFAPADADEAQWVRQLLG